MSDATHEHPPRGLHLRPERAGHPGQRGDRGPAPGRTGLRRDARRVGGVVDQRRRRASSSPAATGSMATWPAATAPPARAPSSTRWPTRPVVLGALFTLAAQGHLPWLPGHPHHGPRGRHAALPLLGGPPRRVHPGPQVGQAQDAGAGLRRSAPCIIPPLAHQHGLQVAMIWFACALTLYTGAEYLIGRPSGAAPACCPVRSRREDRDRGGRHRAACWARSPTPTRPGWASTWPPTAWPRTSTRRSATTTTASCWRCAPRWPAATASSCAAGSGPTQDDITREAIAEVMGVDLVRDQAHRRPHRRVLRGPRPRHDGEQRPPGRRPAGRHRHPAGGRHRARASSARSGTR